MGKGMSGKREGHELERKGELQQQLRENRREGKPGKRGGIQA